MARLQFDKLAAIQASIQDDDLDDLVAVFSRKDGPELLHVYNRDHVEPGEGELHRTLLRDLLDIDLQFYNGLVSCFSVLDTLRDDLLTKGSRFFPIEDVFRERGYHRCLYHTMHHLAGYLIDSLLNAESGIVNALRYRIQSKAIQMALPAILLQQPCNNLVAVIPDQNLAHFITEGKAQFITIDDLQSPGSHLLQDLSPEKDWLVALEEVTALSSGIPPTSYRFIELRDILKSAGKEVDLRKTCYTLARFFAAPVSGKVDTYRAAVTLIVEYWLAEHSCEDLIAFCPDNDFTAFAETGSAIRIYRTLEGDASCCSSSERVGKDISLKMFYENGLEPGFDLTLVTLPSIAASLRGQKPAQIFDLAPIIWKTGRHTALARTLWLLSQELARGLDAARTVTVQNLKEIQSMAVQACLIYSLEVPWHWRQGRYELCLEGSYRNLHTILEMSEGCAGEPDRYYYQALKHWYGCWLALDPSKEINNMLLALIEYRAAATAAGQVSEELLYIENLYEIGETVQRLSAGTGAIESKVLQPISSAPDIKISVPDALRRIIVTSPRQSVLSPLFAYPWNALLQMRRRRQYLPSQERDVTELNRELGLLLNRLRLSRRLLFVPAHEYIVLNFAYEQEIDHLETLIDSLQSTARLTVDLENDWVDLHQPAELFIMIANAGMVKADSVEVVLTQPSGFELQESSPIRTIDSILPGSFEKVSYSIQVDMIEAELRLEYSFYDLRGQRHSDSFTARLNVRNIDQEQFIPKINRYRFGLPIKNPGDFYGRRDIVEDILSNLMGGGKQNMLLTGPRRMGKTTMLYMIYHALTHPETLRLFGIPPSWDEQLHRFRPLYLSLHSFSNEKNGVPVEQFFYALLDKVATRLKISAVIRRHALDNYSARRHEVGVVNAALEAIDQIMDQRPDLRVLVLLDEYDEIYQPHQSSGLDRNLREFISSEQRLTWLISSTQVLFKEVISASSPWFNLFTIVELKNLSRDAAIDLVDIPSRDQRVFWRTNAILDLLAETGQHPAFTQLFCARVIKYLNLTRTNFVTPNTIQIVARTIVNEQETAHTHFEFYWTESSGIGQLIMLILDETNTPLKRDEIRRVVFSKLKEAFGAMPLMVVKDKIGEPVEWQEREFKTGMEWLEKVTNACSADSQRRFLFTVPLFQRWLERYRGEEPLLSQVLNKIQKEMERDCLAA